jgi:flagella basal body P-ring formation protein FlgA
MTFAVLLSLAVLAVPGRAACVSISGERILARDLAQAVPIFAALPPELAMGYAPASGSRRTYSIAELARIAHGYGLAEPQAEACFTRALETLTPEKVEAAVRAVLPGARIEIVDFSRQPVPPGELRLPLSGLCPPRAAAPEDPLLWRGHAGPAGEVGLPIWVKVRIHLAGNRVVATETIEAGRRIERGDVRLEAFDGPPGWPDLPQVLGRALRQRVEAGTLLETRMLADADDVMNGENVRVVVLCGRAHILLEGQAQGAGKRGETIGVRNPATGKLFRARVEARGEVSVAAFLPSQGEHR